MTPRSSKRKAKERQEKAKPVFAPTPGPGEYTPRRQSSTTAKFAGSAAFKSSSSSVSSSARGACYLRDMGDVSALPRALIYLRRFMLALLTSARTAPCVYPLLLCELSIFTACVPMLSSRLHRKQPGSYDPYAHLSMGSQSARTFNKSMQQGTGKFGSRSGGLEFATGIGPGAAGYDPAKVRPRWIHNPRKLSPGFSTKSKRSQFLKSKSQAPDPGRYHPKFTLQDKRTHGGDSDFNNRTPRFSKEKVTLGPGHYRVESHTLVNSARASTKMHRAYTSTRADLFRAPRVRVYV